jgi:uncharacterized protein (TIGR02757 family)
MHQKNIKVTLENLYRRYNRRTYVHPDPLEFLYSYPDIKNREIVGLIASSLAYGKVKQILKSVSLVLDVMKPSPYRFLMNSNYSALCNAFEGFTHRFASGTQLAGLLWGAKNVIAQFGSLNGCFIDTLSPDDETLIPAMTFFAKMLTTRKNKPGHLVALPEKGSACKRMNLFLRWMVRKDRVDPGGWVDVPLSKLIVPLDTHMHKISLQLGFTSKKQANMHAALEITDGFKKLVPEDPVKYDFSLTRFGIREGMNMNSLLTQFSPA